MPIYEYRCQACHQTEEVMQKLADAPKVTCGHCGKDALIKAISAAGFQLAGSGWYASGYQNTPPASTTDTKAEKPADKSATPAATPSSPPAAVAASAPVVNKKATGE